MARPKGSKNRTKSQVIEDTIAAMPPIYKCTACGKVKVNPDGFFYKVNKSNSHSGNAFYSHICKDCTQNLFDSLSSIYQNGRTALFLVCALTDTPFYEDAYRAVIRNNKENFVMSEYVKMLNGTQYTMSMSDYLSRVISIGGVPKTKTTKSKADEHSDQTEEWNKTDCQNRDYVIEIVGYDCFPPETYKEEDRRYLYNTMVEYIGDDAEDNHKIQSIVRIVVTLLQIKTIDSLINTQMSRAANADFRLVDTLIGTKDKLLRLVNTTASDNGISAKSSSKASKKNTTFSSIIKEMADNGFEEVKTDFVSSKMSESYKEIARESTRAIFQELNFTSDEYAKMVSDQSKQIIEKDEKIETLEEEVRRLKIRIKSMEATDEKSISPPT